METYQMTWGVALGREPFPSSDLIRSVEVVRFANRRLPDVLRGSGLGKPREGTASTHSIERLARPPSRFSTRMWTLYGPHASRSRDTKDGLLGYAMT